VAMKFPDWCEKRNKEYKKIKNCFISIESNHTLLEYMCRIVLKVFEKVVKRISNEKLPVWSIHRIMKPLSLVGSFSS
jgi:hypothetical protein